MDEVMEDALFGQLRFDVRAVKPRYEPGGQNRAAQLVGYPCRIDTFAAGEGVHHRHPVDSSDLQAAKKAGFVYSCI
ncbi:hypothetical protein D3C72_2442880 [compost metagenome]